MSSPAPNGAADLLRRDRIAALHSAAAVAADSVATFAWLGWLGTLALVVDRAFVRGDSLDDLTAPLVVMGVLLVLRLLATIGASSLAEGASVHLRGGLRTQLTAALAAGDPRRLGGGTVGEVSGTITEGVEAVGAWVSQYLRAASMAVVGPVAAFALVAVLDAPTTLILLFTGPMLVLLLAVIGRRTADLTRRRFDELGWLRGFYLDLLRGIGTLKAFGRSRDGSDLIEQSSRRFGETTLEVLRTAFQTSLVMEWAATAATALVAVEVSFRMIRGDLTFGTALAVLVVTPEFFAPLRRLSLEYHVGRTGDAAAGDISTLLAGSDPPGVSVASDGTPGTPAVRPWTSAPRIEFESVHYRYPGANRDALDGIDLTIEAGESVALVGPSGAGKSTIASMLLRFILPDSGTLRVDGVDAATTDPALWRRGIAWVPQSPTLLNGTVAENIALGRPDATAAEIAEAAGLAGADGFVRNLPQGYRTHLGEEALRLSGGQRQRLAIARALLLDAPVVVFDEFTAHLDPATEDEVLEAAATLFEGRTVMLVAHRRQTQELADRIVPIAPATRGLR